MPFPLAYHRCYDKKSHKKDCSLVFSQDSLLRLTHLLIIGVTGKPYLSCLSCHSHPIRPCGAPSPRGEGCDTGIPSSKQAAHHPCEPIRSPNTVIPSEAEGSLLHCRHMHTCALVQTTPWYFLFRLRSQFTALQKGSLHFGPHDTQERRIVSHSFSHRFVDPSCAFGAGRLASQEGALMGRPGASLD
mgnify:CR=1 FL=1